LRNTFYLYLFYQFTVIGIHCIQSVHHIVHIVFPMGCAIKQSEQRVKFRNSFSCGVCLICTKNTLRLVNNHNRIGLSQYINGSATTKLITSGEYNACSSIATTSFLILILIHGTVECLGIDNHHVQSAIAGETIYLGKLLGVIDKELDTLAVFCGKVFLHGFKTFLYTFTNGNTWYYYDKLIPTIQFVQFVHCFDVGISLTSTSLHFNGEHQV